MTDGDFNILGQLNVHILSNGHRLPDVVHLFGRDLLPPNKLAFVYVSDGDAVPFVPQIGGLHKQNHKVVLGIKFPQTELIKKKMLESRIFRVNTCL